MPTDSRPRVSGTGQSPPFDRVGQRAPAKMTGVEDLEEVYRSIAPRLWRALVAYTGDPEIASDAVAEAFAQALHRGAALNAPDRWIWTSAFRIAAGELKERSAHMDALPERSYDMPEEAIFMTNVLRRLSPNQRACVVLHYYADLPDRRIAEILGIGTPTVRVHLMRGRRRLRQLLEEDDA
jgi:RNA polymerase sigma-70 factor (ECF subfamily)